MICVASSAVYLLLMQFLCTENIVRKRDDAVLKCTHYRAKQIPFRPDHPAHQRKIRVARDRVKLYGLIL